MSLCRLTALAALVFTAACRSTPVAPDGALLGRFGAASSELVLTPTEVRLRGGCGEFVGKGALVPDPEGRFIHTLRSLSTIRGLGAYIIRGRVDGDVIRGEILTISAVNTVSATFTYTRNVSPNFSGILCAA